MNAIEQLIKQTNLTIYRISKITGVSSQLIQHHKKKQFNLSEAVKLANLLKQNGSLKKNILLEENEIITKI
jgi:hypothetical protein